MTQRSLLMSDLVNYVAETEYKDFSKKRQSSTRAFYLHYSLCVFAHLHHPPQNNIGQRSRTGHCLSAVVGSVPLPRYSCDSKCHWYMIWPVSCTCGFCSITIYSYDNKCHWYMMWAACFTCGFCSITIYSRDKKCHWYMIWAACFTCEFCSITTLFMWQQVSLIYDMSCVFLTCAFLYTTTVYCLDTFFELHVLLAGSVPLAQCFCGGGYGPLIHVTSRVFRFHVLYTLSRRS